MCPPFGSDETIMAYVMPLGWGHPPHQFTLLRAEGLDSVPRMIVEGLQEPRA